MECKQQIILGDFLDSYIYNDISLFHTSDNILWVIKTKDIPSGILDFSSLLGHTRSTRFEMDQFMTDFDIAKDKLYYCNTDGVFVIDILKGKKSKTDYCGDKIWDADVQCIKAGQNDQIAMSAAQDGLYEYNAENNMIHQITPTHSVSCAWSCESIWNYPLNGPGSFFEYLKNEKNQISYRDEHTAESIFQKEAVSVAPARKEKIIYGITGNRILGVRYQQHSDTPISFRECTSIPLNDTVKGNTTRFEPMSIQTGRKNIPLYVAETDKGLYVIDNKGTTVYQNHSIEAIAGWRTFQGSRNHPNQLHLLFDDRIEILTFSKTVSTCR